jgi:aminoglycoside 2''-phosphotransferase
METKESKYVNYIKSKYPQMDISNIEFNFTDGKHADILILNKKEVFKFAKYDWSAGFIENEVRIINQIGKSLSIPLPKAESLEIGIAKFTYIKGEPLYRNTLLQLGGRIQDMVAEQLAIFLKQLHSISLKGEGIGNLSECQASMNREDWLNKYEEIQRKVFPFCDSYSKEYFRQIFSPLVKDKNFMDYHPCLIHGDLMPYHLIYNKGSNRISGVIDFGLSGIGDPAYDVGVVLDNLGEGFVKRMSKYYKNITYFIDRSRFYAYVSSLTWAQSMADMLSARDFSKLRITAKERDIMPIGTRWFENKGNQ